MKKSIVTVLSLFVVIISGTLISCGEKKALTVDKMADSESDGFLYTEVGPDAQEEKGVEEEQEKSFNVFEYYEDDYLEKNINPESVSNDFFPSYNLGAGCYITPNKGREFAMYKAPDINNDNFVDYLKSGQVGVILYTYEFDHPFPENDTFIKVYNLNTGNIGWILYEYGVREPSAFTSWNYTQDDVLDFTEERVNAKISVKKSTVKVPYTKRRIYLNRDGSRFAVLTDSSDIKVYNTGDDEPFEEIKGDKFTPSLNHYTQIQFSSDNKGLYILQEKGDLFLYDFEERATSKVVRFKFEEGGFEEPQQLAISPDERFFYVIADMYSYSRRVPRLLVYDTKKENLNYFDIRTARDEQRGYYYYSDIQFNPDNEALFKMWYGDQAIVKFYLNAEDELTYDIIQLEKRDTGAIAQVFYDDDYSTLVYTKIEPLRFGRMTLYGNEISNSEKYMFDSASFESRKSTTIYVNHEKSLIAAVTATYNEYNNYVNVDFYSLKTLNLLYSLNEYISDIPEFIWKGNNIILSDKKSQNVRLYTIDIEEKADQMSLVYNVSPYINNICSGYSDFAEDRGITLVAYFNAHGFYCIKSMAYYDYDSASHGYIKGLYDFKDAENVVLYEAGVNGTYLDEEEQGKAEKLFLNIPLLRKGGTFKMRLSKASSDNYDYDKEEERHVYKVYTDYYAK